MLPLLFPGNAADVVALVTFDEPLPFPRLAQVVEERLLPFERFCQRVEPRALGGATWEPDPKFRLDNHLSRAQLVERTERKLEELGADAQSPGAALASPAPAVEPRPPGNHPASRGVHELADRREESTEEKTP